MSDHFGNIPIENHPLSTSGKKTHKTTTSPAQKTAGDKKTPTNKRKIWLWTTLCLLLSGIYCIAGFFIFPYYLTDILPEKIARNTDFTLDAGKVTFNPLTFRLTSQNGPILYQAGTPVISLQSFTADLAPLLLLRNDLVCNAVTVEKLDINITRNLDGTYNFEKLFSGGDGVTPSDIMNFSDLPFFFSLNNITIKDSSILFHDKPTGKTHTIKNIHLELPTFSNIPFQADKYIRPRFSAVVNGSPVKLSGKALMGDSKSDTLTTHLSCDIDSLNLSLYAEYLPFKLPFIITHGKANGIIDLNFDPSQKKGDKLSIHFDVQIVDAQFINHDKSISVTAPSLTLNGDLQPAKQTLHISSIVMKEPQLRSYGDSFLHNLGSFLLSPKQSVLPGTPDTAPFSLLLDLFTVDNGTFTLYPDKQSHTAKTTWNSLQLSVKNFSTIPRKAPKESGCSFLFSGDSNSSSSYFSWQGQLDSSRTLTGQLNINSIPAGDLFGLLDSKKSFNVKGRADCKGKLTLYREQSRPDIFSVKLADTEITIQDFVLLENKRKVLSAPIVKFSALNSAKEIINFGTISIQNVLFQLPYKKLSTFLQNFTEKKHTFDTFNFAGKTVFIATDKTPLLTFPSLSLKIDGFDRSKKSEANLFFLAKTEDKGIVKAKGNFQLNPFSLSLQTGFDGLQAQKVFSLLSNSNVLQTIDGKLSGNGSISLPESTFRGELRLESAFTKTENGTLLHWGDVYLQGLNLSTNPFHLGIAEVDFENSDLSWQVSTKGQDPMQDIASFLKNILPKASQPAKTTKKITISPVDIQEVNFNNGKIRIYDRRLTPNWEAEIRDFNGTISGLHSAQSAETGKYTFEGVLDDSKLQIEGEIAFFKTTKTNRFSLELEAYPLASFHKQLAPYISINTGNGEFDVHLDGAWENDQLKQSGTLVFSGIESVSLQSDSALILAFLAGPDNTFSIDFHSSQLSETDNSLVDKLLTHFQTLRVKSAISPLLLATGDFTDLIGNERAEFLPGKIELSSTGRQTLSRYTTLLNAHPHIGLKISGSMEKDQDTTALLTQLEMSEKQRVEVENRKRFSDWQKKKLAYEIKISEQEKSIGHDSKIIENDIPIDVLSDYIPLKPEAVTVNTDMLLKLSQKRAEFVYQYFVSQPGLSSDRIFLPETNTPDQVNHSSLCGVHIQLTPANTTTVNP